jgi:hypothetical protein
MRKLLTVVAMASILSGCASPVQQRQIRVSVDSFPAGAVLTVLGTNLSGPAPQTWTWNLKPDSPAGTIPIMARWVSGATATKNVTIGAGRESAVLIQRPSAPGPDADVQWAIATQQRADDKVRESQLAIALALRSFNEDKEARIKQQQVPMPPPSASL